jgi:hypothetical protein
MKIRFFLALSILIIIMSICAAAEITIEGDPNNVVQIGYRDCPETDQTTGLPVPVGFAADGTKTSFEITNLYYDGLNYYPWEGEICQEGESPIPNECWPDPFEVVGHQEAFVCNQLYNEKQVVWIFETPNFFSDTVRLKKIEENTWSFFDWDFDDNYDYLVPSATGDPWDISPLYSPQRPGTPIGMHDPNWNSDTSQAKGREYAVLVPTGYSSMLEDSQVMLSSTEFGDRPASVKAYKSGTMYWELPEFTLIGIIAIVISYGIFLYFRKK